MKRHDTLKPKSRCVITSAVILWIVQAGTYLLGRVPIRLRYRAAHRYTSNLSSLSAGALIVSNHQSPADPFTILAHLPIREYFKIIPVRFPVLNEVFYSTKLNPRWFPVLSFWGCFPVGNETADRMRTIFYIRELLNDKQTVMLFPEGRISKKPRLLDLKRGVDFFLTNTEQVLFVKISGFHQHNSDKQARHIVYSKVFNPPPSMSAEEIREYLENL